MKKYVFLLIGIGLLSGSWSAVPAQDPTPGAEPPEGGLHKRSPGARAGFMAHQKKGGGMQHVEAWLARLQEQDPAEYERLNTLRETQPDAFRLELRTRLKKESARRSFEDFPQVSEALKNMTPEDRQRFLNRFGPRPGPERGGEESGAFLEMYRKIRKLAEAYALADNEDLREDIRAQLKSRLGQLHQARQQARKEHLQRIEQEIQKLRSAIEEDQHKRDAFIEEQLNRILDSGASAPPVT